MTYSKWILYFLAFFSSIQSFALNYFVDAAKGNNSHTGLTNELAKKTIQAAANLAKAGDTVFVAAGNYSEMVIIKNSGSDNKYVVFKAMGLVVVEDPCPTTTTCGVYTGGGIIEINNKDYIVIDGFTLKNSVQYGINAQGGNHIVIQNNHTYNTGKSGIKVGPCQHVKVLNNLVEKACYHTTATKLGGSAECITIAVTTDFEVAYNEVRFSGYSEDDIPISQGGEGIDAKSGSSNGVIHHNKIHDLYRLGIYIDSWNKYNSDIKVYSNEIWRCAEGIVINSENGGTVDGVSVYNNVIYDNAQSGIALMDYADVAHGAVNGPRKNISIFNNTLYHNGYKLYKLGSSGGGGIWIGTNNIENITIRNNIISKSNRFQFRLQAASATKVLHGNNLIDGFKNSFGEVNAGSTDVIGYPQFTDSLTRNLSIVTGSPAIDKGFLSGAPVTDFLGITRPQGSGVDLGAFEYKDLTNQLPVVSLTSPLNNSVITNALIMQLEAISTDPDGTIEKVEFYEGSLKLGEATKLPYQIVWKNVAAGIHELTAKAFDNKAASAISEVVTIVVKVGDLFAIEIMQAFTPNGDGQNDVWKIESNEVLKEMDIAIYNDKGQLVFNASPFTIGWDGTKDSKPLATGAYYYILTLDGDELKKGSFLLLR